MCGLIGIINSCPNGAAGARVVSSGSYKLNTLFKDMLLASAVRGTDGTGVFQVDGGYKVWTGKHAVASGYAVALRDIDAMIKDVCNSPISVGHVRAATQGKVNDDNCHPFQGWRDNGQYIIGVHNGTLYGWDTPKNDFDVDSAWAIDLIASQGKAAFDEIYGAYAFMWYDTEQEGKVLFVRNSERPLHVARTADKRSLIFASEAGMLQWLCDKHDIAIEDVFSVDEGFIMSVDTKELELTIKEEERIDDPWQNYVGPSKRTPITTIGGAWPVSTVVDDKVVVDSGWSLQKIETIKAVKDSLRQARYANHNLTGTDADDDSPPFEMGSDAGDDPLDIIMRAKDEWFDATGVPENDIKRAMYAGAYGMLVQYDGVTFDTFTDSVVGEIVAPTVMKTPLAYVLDVPPHVADMYKGQSRTMVVVGARLFGGETEYVVTDLNDVGERELAA